ncbi:uncharacterized protein [Dermacentor andersoni]|uniref:uncharacterized protein n=1 Tax=Dermacentor andersoni TaxID=34620 RepID=UPI003B3BA831
MPQLKDRPPGLPSLLEQCEEGTEGSNRKRVLKVKNLLARAVQIEVRTLLQQEVIQKQEQQLQERHDQPNGSVQQHLAGSAEDADPPEVWFAQVEAQFALAQITQERTRYDYVVAHLDARYASEVRDILANPPTANLYEHLKMQLIRRLSPSEDQKVRQLQSAELAERKPSQLLRHMRALAGNMEVQDSLLRALWLQRLPPHVQAILQAQLTLPLDQLAGIADRVIEVSLPPLSPTVQAVAAPRNTIELARRIGDINRHLSFIQRRLDQHLPTRHSQSRGQNTTPSQQPEPVIGSDSLAHYNLLPDCRHDRLIDATTRHSAPGQRTTTHQPSIKVPSVEHNSPYHAILAEFPGFTRPSSSPRDVQHTILHYIRTTPGPLVFCRARRLAPDCMRIAKAEFEAMLREGIARPSDGPWASPLHLVPKKTEGWRPCGDYRALNARTIPDRFPVHHIQDFAHCISGCPVFSVLDLVKAYKQIPVNPDDVPKTAIITPFGLFEFPFMSFGLRNAGQTYQRFIDEVVRGLDFCFVYLDDILVFSRNTDEHHMHLRLLFQCLDDHGSLGQCPKEHARRFSPRKTTPSAASPTDDTTTPAPSSSPAYYRELLAIYEAVHHFRHILEAQHCTIYTDHKPLTYAFSQRRDKLPPVQQNQLSFIVQFTTDIHHVSGKDNEVADALSRVAAISPSQITADVLAEAQTTDAELQQLLESGSSLQLQQVPYLNRQRLSTATYQQHEAGLTRPFPIAVASLTSYIISAIPAYAPLRASWLTAMSGPPCSGIAAPGRAPAFNASTLKSPGMSLHHSAHSPRPLVGFNTSTLIS